MLFKAVLDGVSMHLQDISLSIKLFWHMVSSS